MFLLCSLQSSLPSLPPVLVHSRISLNIAGINYSIYAKKNKTLTIILMARFDAIIWNSPNRLKFGTGMHMWLRFWCLLLVNFHHSNFRANLASKSCYHSLKRLLKIAACLIFSLPNWSKFVFSNSFSDNKDKIHSMYSS